MKTVSNMWDCVCDDGKCDGCYACKELCPKNAIEIVDQMRTISAHIDPGLCIGCNLCKKVCPRVNMPEFFISRQLFQGWAIDPEIRRKSASGGFARAISEKFLQQGGRVVSCTFRNGAFLFESADSVQQLDNFRGSKYVKSNPESVYQSVYSSLSKGNETLFVGLPCQVAGLKNYIKIKDSRLIANLTTIDLICHGTPSVKILQLFLKENGTGLEKIKSISFRQGNQFSVGADASIVASRVRDRYMIGFMRGAIYTENCYSCQYAKKDRVSDLTLGDSWGSDMTEELPKGISLVLCQTDKGKCLLKEAAVELFPVDINKAYHSNGQLTAPSAKPVFYDSIFRQFANGRSFSKVIFQHYKKECSKQMLKKMLINAHVIK